MVSFDGAALQATVTSSAQLTATGNAPTAKSGVSVVVNTTDGEVSNTVPMNVTAPTAVVTVSVSPTSGSVRVKSSMQFAAAVSKTSNTAVTWTVNGITGGNGSIGTISSSGLYRAPNTAPRPATVTVSATSVADPAKNASASVTIVKR